MTTFNATPILGGNTTARIKLPDLPDGKQYTAKCGTSGTDQPNDRGVGVMLPPNPSGKECEKLGFVVLAHIPHPSIEITRKLSMNGFKVS
ncbi:MAG: hypothetical protein EBR67_06975 [Proteobacteria bacterium]|nr:hypothetical protein [Pseudomonadota bacterium]